MFEPDLLEGDWRGRLDGARRWLDGSPGRIGIHGPYMDLPMAPRDHGIRDLVRRRLDEGLDACALIGATQMVIHSPFTTWMHNHIACAEDMGEVVARCHATLADAVARAEVEGVVLVIENIEDKDPAARVALARSFGSPAIKVSLDTGHALYAHRSTGAPPVDHHVLAAGADLAHIHIQDADGHGDRHWMPGMGTVNWRALFAALDRTGARPRLILELNDIAQTVAGARHLAGLGLVR